MKKFMFSAIAMIAFVGSSMANNSAIEEEKEAGKVNCATVAMAALDAADPKHTMTSHEAGLFYQGQYDACIKSTKSVSTN